MKNHPLSTPTFVFQAIAVLCFICIAFAGCREPEGQKESPADMNQSPIVLSDNLLNHLFDITTFDEETDSLIRSAYLPNKGKLLWFEGKELKVAADSLAAELSLVKNLLYYKCHNCGNLAELMLQVNKPNIRMESDSLARLDFFLTAHFYLLIDFHHTPKIFPGDDMPLWEIPYHTSDPQITIENFIAEPSRNGFGVNGAYRFLFNHLPSLQIIQAAGGWPVVPDNKKLEFGITDPAVTVLRQRLSITGAYDIDSSFSKPAYFDSLLQEGVMKFQQSCGLNPDGIVGSGTFKALNISVEERISQLIVNMERWRWLAGNIPNEYLLVNIPQYALEYIRDDSLIIDMSVVVGKKRTSTPVFMDTMEYLILSPYWHVPNSIAKGEILPQLQAGEDYLTDNNMEVIKDGKVITADSIDWQTVSETSISYKFRQKPGSFNSLGTIKFIFPNKHYVYLHDTNAKSYFKQFNRARSHGCVRISKPVELAEILLHGIDDWDIDKINEKRLGGKQVRVNLPTKLPVIITYFTCGTDKSGKFYWWNDVYEMDEKLKEKYYRPIKNGQSSQVVVSANNSL